MIFKDNVTFKITQLTNDESYQTMFMLHRYLCCACALCHFVLKYENDQQRKHSVRQYLDNLKIASGLLYGELDDNFSYNSKQRKAVKTVCEETWADVYKEVENYIESNNLTKKGMIEHLKLADKFAFAVIRLMIKNELDRQSKNLTNLKN